MERNSSYRRISEMSAPELWKLIIWIEARERKAFPGKSDAEVQAAALEHIPDFFANLTTDAKIDLYHVCETHEKKEFVKFKNTYPLVMIDPSGKQRYAESDGDSIIKAINDIRSRLQTEEKDSH